MAHAITASISYLSDNVTSFEKQPFPTRLPLEMIPHKPNLETILHTLEDEAKKKNLSLSEIFHILSGKGRSLVLIFLSLPFCQPIQIPGFSIPFGVAIAFISLRMVFGKEIWLPKKLLNKRISSEKLVKITHKILFFLQKLNRFSHQRLSFLSQSRIMHVVNCMIICILGLFLALPLPIPLSNIPAAWSIFLISFGVLKDDGLFVLIGFFIFAVTAFALTILGLSL